MSMRIPLSVPQVGTLEEEAVLTALRSGWITSGGPQLAGFEAELAELTGRSHAVAVSSGTAALHLALLAAGVGPGDYVPCATLTFAATANAIRYTGATPVFIDCDATGNIDPRLLDDCLADFSAIGKPVGAVVPVDLFGRLADHDAIAAVAASYDVPVIVDAAESLGAVVDGRPAGSFGTAATLSFNGNKIITTSGGGAVVCDSAETAAYIDHLARQARQPVAHYEHEEIGYNYRLSNLLAALGSAQLTRLPEFLSARRAHRSRYRAGLEPVPGIRVLGEDDAADNCWLTALLVDARVTGFDAAAAMTALSEVGIETRPVFKPMHLQPVFADRRTYPRYLTGQAEALYATGLLVPSSPATSAAECDEVIEHLNRMRPAPNGASVTATHHHLLGKLL